MRPPSRAPATVLVHAALEELRPHVEALREHGWPAELEVDIEKVDVVVSLRMRVGTAMLVPAEATERPIVCTTCNGRADEDDDCECGGRGVVTESATPWPGAA